MKLKLLNKEALVMINTSDIRQKLSKLLGKHENQIRRYIKANDRVLTCKSVLELLNKEFPGVELMEK